MQIGKRPSDGWKRKVKLDNHILKNLKYAPEKLFQKYPDFFGKAIHSPAIQTKVSEIMKKSKPASVLEIGPGIRPLTASFNGERIFMDASREVLKKLPGRGIWAKMEQLPIKKNKFDMTVLSSVFYHVPPEKIEQCTREITRTSNEVILYEIGLGLQNEAQIVTELEKQKFRICEIKDATHSPEFHGFFIHAKRKVEGVVK